MPRDGSGNYTLPAGNPVVTDTLIESTWANTTLSDIASALTGSLPRDGSAAMSGNLNLANNKLTNVANGTASTDGVSLSQVQGISKVNLTKVRRLVAGNNSTTPNTKVDMVHNGLVMRNAAGLLINIPTPSGTITCDIGLAGPAANGRDQVAVFAGSAVVHFYFIYNPTTTTMATIASLANPLSSGPTLPSGYEYWTYAFTLVLTPAGIMMGFIAMGNRVAYNTAQIIGSPTSSTTIAIRPWVPEIAESFSWMGTLNAVASGGGNCYINMLIGTNASQLAVALAFAGVAGTIGVAGRQSDIMNFGVNLVVSIIPTDIAAGSASSSHYIVDYVVPNY